MIILKGVSDPGLHPEASAHRGDHEIDGKMHFSPYRHAECIYVMAQLGTI